MRRRWIVFGVVLILVIVGAFFCWDMRASPVATNEVDGVPIGISVGRRAPDFSGTTVDGETVNLRDFRGRTVLVNVFASWCGPCIAETPHLVEASEAYPEDFVVLGVNLQESSDAVLAYLADFGIAYPLVMDPNSEITSVYQPIGLPTSWFIDSDGIVTYVHVGPMTYAQIHEAYSQAQ